jgi:hypothetical protein
MTNTNNCDTHVSSLILDGVKGAHDAGVYSADGPGDKGRAAMKFLHYSIPILCAVERDAYLMAAPRQSLILGANMLKRRPFGKTGLDVSELILGAGYVGGIIIHASDDTRRALIRRLLEAGINWIDTAESYGQGASEEALGWLLAELPEDQRPYIHQVSPRHRPPGRYPRPD